VLNLSVASKPIAKNIVVDVVLKSVPSMSLVIIKLIDKKQT